MHDLIAAVGQYGLAIVVVNVLLNQIGLPDRQSPTLVLAGAIAADGRLPLLPLLLGSMLACLAADSAWFVLGRGTESVCSRLCAGFRWSLIPA